MIDMTPIVMAIIIIFVMIMIVIVRLIISEFLNVSMIRTMGAM